jgi:hypothetical protein
VMVVFLSVVTFLEGWRALTAPYPTRVHAFIDTIICAYICAFTLVDLRRNNPRLGVREDSH